MIAGWLKSGWITAGWLKSGWMTADWLKSGWLTAGWLKSGWMTACWHMNMQLAFSFSPPQGAGPGAGPGADELENPAPAAEPILPPVRSVANL